MLSPRHRRNPGLRGLLQAGGGPDIWVRGASGAHSWILAESPNNPTNLSVDFGWPGGFGDGSYWLGSIVVARVIYLMRTPGWSHVSRAAPRPSHTMAEDGDRRCALHRAD